MGDANVDFGTAITNLKSGLKVARQGWNGKGMWLFLLHGKSISEVIKNNYGNGVDEHLIVDSICMKTAQNTIVVGWLASQTDMLAEDWQVVE